MCCCASVRYSDLFCQSFIDDEAEECDEEEEDEMFEVDIIMMPLGHFNP